MEPRTTDPPVSSGRAPEPDFRVEASGAEGHSGVDRFNWRLMGFTAVPAIFSIAPQGFSDCLGQDWGDCGVAAFFLTASLVTLTALALPRRDSGKITRLRGNAGLAALLVAGLFPASALCMAVCPYTSIAVPLGVAGGVLAGAGLALLALLWLGTLRKIPLRTAFLAVCQASVLGFLFFVAFSLLSGLSPWVGSAWWAVVALVSVALLPGGSTATAQGTNPGSLLPDSDLPKPRGGTDGLFLLVTVENSLAALLSGLNRFVMPDFSNGASILSAALVLATLCVAIAIVRRVQWEVTGLTWAIPLAMAGAAMIMLASPFVDIVSQQGPSGHLSYLFWTAGSIAFPIINWITLVLISRESRPDWAKKPAANICAFSAALLVGMAAAPLVGENGMRVACGVTLCLLVIANGVFIVRTGALIPRGGVACLDASAQEDRAAADQGLESSESRPLEEAGAAGSRIRELAERFELSDREREVFAFLAQGYGSLYISQRLYVSESTVKTHRRRIYAKMGVSNREGMLELVNHPESPFSTTAPEGKEPPRR